jgi:hypothetical protein
MTIPKQIMMGTTTKVTGAAMIQTVTASLAGILFLIRILYSVVCFEVSRRCFRIIYSELRHVEKNTTKS